MRRYESRTFLRKIMVAQKIRGSTANVISASFQFMFNMIDQNAGKHEDIFENRNHARGEHFIERVDIGRNPRDQASHGILVEEADVHVLQVTENLAAQVEHDFLSGPLHVVGLQEFEQEAKDQQAHIDAADLRDTRQAE